MPQPAEVDALSDEIRAIYRTAWEQIDAAQQAIAADPSRWRARRRLTELRRSIEQAMDGIDTQARAWVAEQYPLAYGMGATTAAGTIGVAFSWTAPHSAAVRALARQTWDDLLAASNGVRRSTRLLLGKLAREQTIGAVAGGQTATQAASVLADLAEGRGIWSVRYADGSLHGLDDYADMLIRTRSALAYNTGSLTQSKESGVQYMECADGSGCGLDSHDDQPPANGLIMATDEAFAHPLSHPRCRRSWLARPDITTAEQAADASPSTTAAQREDQAAAEQARADAFAARRARVQRTGALQRRQELLAKRAARVG